MSSIVVLLASYGLLPTQPLDGLHAAGSAAHAASNEPKTAKEALSRLGATATWPSDQIELDRMRVVGGAPTHIMCWGDSASGSELDCPATKPFCVGTVAGVKAGYCSFVGARRCQGNYMSGSDVDCSPDVPHCVGFVPNGQLGTCDPTEPTVCYGDYTAGSGLDCGSDKKYCNGMIANVQAGSCTELPAARNCYGDYGSGSGLDCTILQTHCVGFVPKKEAGTCKFNAPTTCYGDYKAGSGKDCGATSQYCNGFEAGTSAGVCSKMAPSTPTTPTTPGNEGSGVPEQCAMSYGAGLDNPCPEDTPKCVGFVANVQWGQCFKKNCKEGHAAYFNCFSRSGQDKVLFDQCCYGTQ